MSQWASGDSLTPSTLNRKLSSAASVGGFSTNTLQPESGTSVVFTGTSRFTSGTALAPGLAMHSEASLGLYRSAASHLVLSYGTFAASGVSAGNLLTPSLVLQSDSAALNYRTAASADRWHVGLNAGGYAADELVVQDRQALNTGVFAFVTGAGPVVGLAGAQLNRSATSGFIYLSSTTDTPTGTPTAVTGKVPLFYDTGNNYLWVYNGSWRSIPSVG